MLKQENRVLDVEGAAAMLKGVAVVTPLQLNSTWSERLDCNIFLKREDLQIVRSYKIRGAYNKMASLSTDQLTRGVICASAGNHAQGVAYSCSLLKTKGVVFMPVTTPDQKIEQVRMFGGNYVDIRLKGDTFDASADAAKQYGQQHKLTFIHPFDDLKVIEGQGTVGREIINQSAVAPDYVFLPVGGGGLASGVAGYLKTISPQTRIVGVEPAGAASLTYALKNGSPAKLKKMDRFIDGAAVQQVGNLTFELCSAFLDDVVTVEEGAVCTTILDLYNRDAIVVEPAGALALTAAANYPLPKGANVVVIMSGSNNDITRMEEIKERSLLNKGLKHYFLVSFPQRAGALKDFVNKVLGPEDDITFFEYAKRHNREKGPVKIGIRLQNPQDLEELRENMYALGFQHQYMNENEQALSYFL